MEYSLKVDSFGMPIEEAKVSGMPLAESIHDEKLVSVDDLPNGTKKELPHILIEQVPRLKDEALDTVKDNLFGLTNPPKVKVGWADPNDLKKQFGNGRATYKPSVEKYKQMVSGGTEFDPVFLRNGKFFDGGHRVEAYIAAGKDRIPVVDIGSLLDMDWDKWLSGIEEGANGDWEKDGYAIHCFLKHRDAVKFVESNPTTLVSLFPSNVPGNNCVYAVKDGEIVAYAHFAETDRGLVPTMVRVDDSHKRKGLASAMCLEMEKQSGKKVASSENTSDDGKALWAQPNRKFGEGLDEEMDSDLQMFIDMSGGYYYSYDYLMSPKADDTWKEQQACDKEDGNEQDRESWARDQDEFHQTSGDPSMCFEKAKKIKSDEWLIHFTKSKPFDIIKSGFRGRSFDVIGLTNYYKDDAYSGSLALAYRIEDIPGGRTSREGFGKYGDNAVVFKAKEAAVAYHHGDEEKQVVFVVSSVVKGSMYPIYGTGSELELYDPKTANPVISVDRNREGLQQVMDRIMTKNMKPSEQYEESMTEMRTKQIKINGKEVEAILMAGGPGFKIYGILGGVLVVAGRKQIIAKESDHDFKPIMKYVNLRYQNADQQDVIKKEFGDWLKGRTATNEDSSHLIESVSNTLMSRFDAMTDESYFDKWFKETEYTDYFDSYIGFDSETGDDDDRYEIARKWLDKRFDDLSSEFDNIADDGKYGLKVYRAISVDDPDEFMFHAALQTYIDDRQGIGIFWSWDKERAKAHWSDGSASEITVVGEVDIKSINIEDTFMLNLNLYLGEYEAEIRLKKGAKVHVVGFYVGNEYINVDNQEGHLELTASQDMTANIDEAFPKLKHSSKEDEIEINMPGYGKVSGQVNSPDGMEHWFEGTPVNPLDLPQTLAFLEYVEIDKEKQSQGAGSKLVQAFIKLVKKDGAQQVWLNASPMGTMNKEMILPNLIRFYRTNGFKVIQQQEQNAIMMMELK